MASQNSMVKDLAGALNQALKPAKIIVMGAGVLVALVVLVGLGALGGLIKTPGVLWIGWIIQTAGVLGAFLVLVANMVAVVCMTSKEESGGKKMSFLGGIGTASANILKVLCALMKPIIFILAGIAVILGLGLIGLIPKVGPVVWGLGLGLVTAVAGLFVVFWMLKLLLGTFVLPAILVEGKEEGVYRHAVQPRAKFLFPAVPAEFSVHFQEHFLGQVFCVLGVSNHSPGHGVHHLKMLKHYFTKFFLSGFFAIIQNNSRVCPVLNQHCTGSFAASVTLSHFRSLL